MIFKSEIAFVKIIFPFIAGIITAYFFQLPSLLRWVALILVSFLIVAALINVFYKKFRLWRYKRTIATFYYFTFFLLGSSTCLLYTDFLQTNYFAHKDYPQLKIWVNNEPQQTNDILRFEATVTQGYQNSIPNAVVGKLMIALKVDSLAPIKLQYGDELMITADYLPVEPPYNPAEFDFKGWLASKNIYHQTFIHQNQVVNLHQQKGNPVVKFALAVRQRQVETYRRLIQNDEAFAVASTLILGYRADLSKETLSAYSKTGTIHALSVSGMHVGIIYIMLTWLLSFLDHKKGARLLKTILICGLIWYYSLLTGFSSSVLRAAIMLTIFIIAKQFKRNNNSYNVLAFTAFALLLYNPFFIWNVGFQLSFLAVFGLIYFHPKIYKWIYIENKWADKLWSTVALSLAAQLATLPLSIYYFHQFPVYFIISNLFILIPVAVLMYVGIAILLIKVHFLAPFFEWLIVFMNDGLKWIANLPFAGITEIWLNPWQLLLLCILFLALSIGFTYFKKRFVIFGALTLILLQTTVGFKKIRAVKQEEIVFFSLRKNYAVAFINGTKGVLVTDLLKGDKNFDFFVRPALDQKQIKNISFVKWKEDFKNTYFVKQENQIQFKENSLLLLDETFNYKKLIGNPNFDFVWMHNSPKQYLNLLKEDVHFNALLLDATNKDYVLSNFKKQAKELNLNTHTLKKEVGKTLKLN